MTAQDMRPPNWREAEALVRINGGAPWLWWSQRRALALAAPAAGVVAGLLLLAPAAEAHGNGHGKGHTPVTVCHHGKSLTMDAEALAAHLAHGDTLGDCVPAPSSSAPCPDPTTSSPEPDPTSSEPTPEPTTTAPTPDPSTTEPEPTTSEPEPEPSTSEPSDEPTTDPVPVEPTVEPRTPVELPETAPADTTVAIVPAAATPTDVPNLASDELAYTGADPLLLGVVGAIALAGGVMLTASVRRGGHQ